MRSDNQFYFILGAECLFTRENWKSPELIFKNCKVIAAVRGKSPLEEMKRKASELQQKFHADIALLPFMNLEISSTMLREKIAKGESVRYLIPDPVLDYIRENKLYQDMQGLKE